MEFIRVIFEWAVILIVVGFFAIIYESKGEKRKKRIWTAIIILGIPALIFITDIIARKKYENPFWIGNTFAYELMMGNKNGITGWGNKKLDEKIKGQEMKSIRKEYAWNEDSSPGMEDFYLPNPDYLKLYKASRVKGSGSLLLTYGFFDQIDPIPTIYTCTILVSPYGNYTLWDRTIGKLFREEFYPPSTPTKWIVYDYYTDSDIEEYIKLRETYINKSNSAKPEEDFEKLFNEWDKLRDEIEREEYILLKQQNEEVKKYLIGNIQETTEEIPLPPSEIPDE